MHPHAFAALRSVNIKNISRYARILSRLTTFIFVANFPGIVFAIVWTAGTPGSSCTVAMPVCPTIQAAVNASANNDVINVLAGTFRENVVVDKSVTISGTTQASTIVQPALSAPAPCVNSSLCGGMASNVFLIQANNVTIQNLTVDGDNPTLVSGIVFGGADIDARNGIISNFLLGFFSGLTVHDVTVRNIFLRGIQVADHTNFNVHHNTVQNVQAHASSVAIFNFSGNGVLANNTVSDCGDALNANHSTGTQFLNNTVTNCGTGVHTSNAGDTAGSVADVIQGNIVSNSSPPGSGDGVGISAFSPVLPPLISNNTITNVDIGLAIFGQGGMATTQFVGNTVDGQFRPNSRGIFVTTDQLGFGTANTNVIFRQNTIQRTNEGIRIEQPASTVTAQFLFNRIIHNTTSVNNTSATLIDAALNWWGCNGGPGVAFAGCAATPGPVIGPVATNPRLVLGVNGPALVTGGATVSYTATLRTDSAGVETSALGFLPNGIPVAFSQTLGALNPANTTTVSALATTNYTANPAGGNGSVSANIDDQIISLAFNILMGPHTIPTLGLPALLLLGTALVLLAWRHNKRTAW